MTPAARYAAAIGVLDEFLAGAPIEKTLSNWARKNRYAGSKDRAAVRDIVFDGLRNLRSYQTLGGSETGRGTVIGQCIAANHDLDDIFSGEGYAPALLSEDERAGLGTVADLTLNDSANLPDWICDIAQGDLGEKFLPTAAALCARAPVDLRVNLAKGSVKDAHASLLSDDITVETVPAVPTALRVLTNPRRVAGSKSFSQGLVELQDAASQAVIGLLDIAAGARVLDYCAGGGGKTLAMAGSQPDAQYAAWDISAARLAPLGERAKRAGAKVHLLDAAPTHPSYDLVLVDAPCSGAGSWRRNPEGKWRLTQDRLFELQTLQAQILTAAADCVVAGGTLVYATCSIFVRENRDQVDAFLAKRSDFTLIKDHSFDIADPSDGFYCAILAKQL